MTVSSEQSFIEYNGNGATQTFAIPFYFILNSDISVTVADASGNLDELTYGVDFSASGGGNPDGGTATLNTAYASGYTILIYRNPPETQETAYYENGKFPAKSHEKALDKLTMLIQKYGWWFDSLALKKPSYLAQYYDAQGNRISNLAAPVNAQDAVTKGYVDSGINKALRVPESSVGLLPAKDLRKNKLLAMNDNGDPISVLPASGSASDVMIELAKPTGAGLVGFNDALTYPAGTVGEGLSRVVASTTTVADLPTPASGLMGSSYNVNGQTIWADTDAFGLKYNKTGMLMRHLALLCQGPTREYARWSDQVIYEDNFTNLSGWTGSTTTVMQVSANKVYSNGAAGLSGMSRALNASTTGKFRLRCLVNFVNDGVTAYSGGVFIGVSSDAAGSAPASGLANGAGIYFAYNQVKLLVNGVVTSIPNSTVPIAGLYEVTIVADDNFISFAAHHTGEALGYEYVGRVTRASKSCNNFVIFNSDARLLSGSSFQSLCYGVGSNATIKSTFEGNYPSIVWTGDGTNDFRIVTPIGYDSRKSRPAVVLFHGNGTNERSWATNANYDKVSKAFVSSGFIVISAAVSGDYNTWGNTLAQACYYSAYRYLLFNYNISAFSVFVNSMGGIEFFNTLISENIGFPCCFVGTSPTANLLSCYNSSALTADVKEAYNIASDGSDYATKTAGFDPVLKRPDEFLGIPQLWLTASDDTIVLPTENRDIMMKLSAISTRKISKVDGITGGHSFDVTPYLTTIVNFVRSYSA